MRVKAVKTLMLLLLAPTTVLAESGGDYFYVNTSLSQTSNVKGTEESWITTFGYSLDFSPSIALDFGLRDLAPRLNSDDNRQISGEGSYQSIYSGAKIQHSLMNRAWIYAKGGFSYTRLDYSDASSSTTTQVSDIAPYVSVGATMPAHFEPNLEFSVEVSYSEDDTKDTNSVLLLGAQYRF